jgi:lysophospholipase L1-like esterase
MNRAGLHLLTAAFAATTFFCAARAETPVADAAGGAPILCIGDSLTFGEGGNGVTYPGALAARTGTPTVNVGLSGFIPRHIVYHVLLHLRPTLSRAQLQGIPPAEYEHRENQPAIDHLRTFILDGQTVWVKDRDAAAAPYRWDANSTLDDDTVIKPAVVGDLARKPVIATGRWCKVTGPAGAPPAQLVYRGVVLCVGANGMEADDVRRSLHTLLEVLAPPHDRFLMLGLMNRADPAKHPEDIAPWAGWIAECNQAIRLAYPDHFLDLQAWFATPVLPGQAGYRTCEWLKHASTAQVASDQADQVRGLLPGSLRAPGNTTHLNGTGYTAIGALVDEWVTQHGWFDVETKR